ncbi:hypothetical protein DV737_g1874, partial [Chaetothyriales sp. CBS 132003]
MITDNINNYPDPTQHWAVLVDDYVHELWMVSLVKAYHRPETTGNCLCVLQDENLDIIYINEKLVPSEWHTFPVGKTHFNDQALRQAKLLDAIQIGAHKKFATSFAVYQRATGEGTIKDLFTDNHPEEQQQDEAEEQEADDPDRPPKLQHTNTLQTAQQVMDEHTTKLDRHRHGFFHRS